MHNCVYIHIWYIVQYMHEWEFRHTSNHTYTCTLTNICSMYTCMSGIQVYRHTRTHIHACSIQAYLGTAWKKYPDSSFTSVQQAICPGMSITRLYFGHLCLCGSKEHPEMHSFLSREGIAHGGVSKACPRGHLFPLRALLAILMCQARQGELAPVSGSWFVFSAAKIPVLEKTLPPKELTQNIPSPPGTAHPFSH